MLEIWLHRFIVATIIGVGVGLLAAGLDPPIRGGYRIDALMVGGGGGLIAFGLLAASRRKTIRKKRVKPEGEED